MGARLTNEERQLTFRLHHRGLSTAVIARELARTATGIRVVLGGQKRDPRPDEWVPAKGHLRVEEREEILLGLREGRSMRAIARTLHRAPSTVTREVKANGGRANYHIWPAHQRARACTKLPKPAKLDNLALCAKVTTWLEEFWSPDEIARRLRREFPGDPTMWVSHETIYQSLYVQGRGELRRELARCLRSGRAKRRPRGREERHGKIPDMVMISERPAEAADRAVPGHWEGDLIIGANNASAVGTLVERTSRFLLLLHLGRDYTAKAVEKAMQAAIATLPRELVRSVTWDSQNVEASYPGVVTQTPIDAR